MEGYFNTYKRCTHIIIRIININININFMYKIKFKNKTSYIYKVFYFNNNALRFLKNCAKYGKMFLTEIVCFGKGHKKIPLIWPWVASLRSDQDHIDFIKRNI